MMLLIIIIVLLYSIHDNEIQCAIRNSYSKMQKSTLPAINQFVSREMPLLSSSIVNEDRSLERLSKIALARDGASKRKSKLLTELAFLNGFGSNNLLAGISSDLKSVIKLPKDSGTLNLSPSGYFTAYQDPYVLFTYPYIFPHPLSGWYPFLNPVKFQPVLLNTLLQPSFGFLDNKKPSEPEPEAEGTIYAEENKKMEDNEFQGDRLKHADDDEDSSELKKNGDPNENETHTEEVATISKEPQTSSTNLPKEPVEEEDLEDHIDEDVSAASKVENTTKVDMPTTVNANKTNAVNLPNATTTESAGNQTESPQFLGYYGGSPPNVDHVILTTETPLLKYQNPRYQDDEVVFNLPFDRPANFNPYDKYEAYANPQTNFFSSADKRLEFLNEEDFNGLTYSYDNPPTLSGFRPIV